MIRFKQFLKENNIIQEGGAFGHLSNVFDVNFSFGDFRDIIIKSLEGNLERTRLKTDGQNLMFTVIDGRIRTARNKGHIKNFGQNSMTAEELAQKFKGRGGLESAYNNAIIDLKDAISHLSDKQIDKIFKNGKKFMSMEVIHVDSPNVVWYGENQLRFHGTKEYDVDGNVIGDFKEDGDIFAGMIRQRGKENQKTFKLRPLEVVKLPQVPNFKGQQKLFISQLEKIMKPLKIKWSDKLHDYKSKYFENILQKQNIYNPRLVSRWAFFDKTYTVADIKKDNYTETQKKWILNFEKSKLQDEWKKMMLPLEFLFLRLGATVLENIKQFMVVNPDESIQKINKKLDTAIKAARSSNDPKMIKKIELELKRIEAAGGREKISPEEGITFMYKGEFLKLTGLFAPVNQLIGLLFKLEEN